VALVKPVGGFTNCPGTAEATADSTNKQDIEDMTATTREQLTGATLTETRKKVKLPAFVLGLRVKL